jgi:outer membrane protein OmpA-like peptidoglycan-associated protein
MFYALFLIGWMSLGSSISSPVVRTPPNNTERTIDDVILISDAVQSSNFVFFPEGGSQLDPPAEDKLRALAMLLNARRYLDTCIQLIGHSDSIGSESANSELSQKRVVRVRDALASLIEDGERRIAILHFGETSPLTALRSDNSWNRRVEIRAKRCVDF